MHPINNIENNSDKRVIIYCRESRDDYMEHYDRIETQRDLLIKFCNKSGYANIIDVVMHNDETGTDFSRFDEIRRKIINDEVDVLVMKDSSRLGRNQLESLKFVELLSEYNVELVFEGRAYDEEFFPLEAWFNERRAKDDSRKIRTNLKHKMEEGKLIVRSHYGYIKEGNKKEGHRLVVDHEVAWVVQKIFKLYLEGYGYRAIATKMNEEQIPTPSQYISNTNKPIAIAWVGQHAKRILENEIYTGTMVAGTTEKVSFKSKKTRRLPEHKWHKVEGTHEAIVSKEDFDAVQNKIKSKQIFAPKTSTPSPFSGLMECGCCGTSMYITRRKDRPSAFLCGKYFKEGKYKENLGIGCTSHRMREDELIEIVKNHISNMLNNEEYRGHLHEKFNNIDFVKDNLQLTIKKLEEKLSHLKNQYKMVYNDKLSGIIPEFIFKDKSSELENSMNSVEQQLKQLTAEIKDVGDIETNIEKIDKAYGKVLEGKIDNHTISNLIEKIVVFDKGEITQEHKTMYNINDDNYNEIWDDGGVVISSKYNVQYAFTSRWLAYLVGTNNSFDLNKYLQEVI